MGLFVGLAATVLLGAGLIFFFSNKEPKLVPKSNDSISTNAPGTDSSKSSTHPKDTPAPVPTRTLDTSKPPTSMAADGALVFNGHRYRLVKGLTSWADAKAAAEALGGHLATINSMEEVDWINANIIPLLNDGSGPRRFWLGGARALGDAEWTWITGEPFSTSLWIGKPSVPSAPEALGLVLGAFTPSWEAAAQSSTIGSFLVEWSDAALSMPVAVGSPLAPPPQPSQPGAINLLAGLDVVKNNVAGDWHLENGELVSDTDATDSEINLPVTALPAEYDVRYHLTRSSGYQMQLRSPGASFVTDGWTGKMGSNDEVEVKWGGPNPGMVVRPTPLLRDGKPHNLIMQVRADRIIALLDGHEVLRHDGSRNTAADTANFSLKIARGKVIFHAIELTPMIAPENPTASTPQAMLAGIRSTSPQQVTLSPAGPLPPGWLDLLAEADPAQGAVTGQWQKEPEGLVVKMQPGVLPFQLNHTPPEEYDFEIEFTVHSNEPDVAHILSLPGGHWFIARLKMNYCCLGQLLDGQQPEGRQVAFTTEAKLTPGRRHRSQVQVREDSVRLLLDEKESLVFKGDLKRLTSDDQFALRNTTHLGIASHQSDVTFHRIIFQPHDPSRLDKKSKNLLLAAHPKIAKLESGFEARYEADAQKPYLAAVAALNKSYVTNGIPIARAAAQTQGRLKDIIALDDEKTRIEQGQGTPTEDPDDTPETLKALRGTYRTALAKITSERDAKATLLYDLYLKALDAHTVELTKANKLNDAQTLQALRADIASRRPTAASAPVASAKPTTTTPPAPTGSIWRTAAEFLANNGATFVVSNSGSNSQVTSAKDIPVGRFDIIEISIDRLNSVLPPLKSQDLLPLVGLRDLRRVWVRPTGSALGDEGLAFLAGNYELNWLNLEGVNDVTDEVLIHLASAKKLDHLAIQYATKFTGNGLDKLPFTETLTSLELLGSGISAEGLKAISTFKQLRVLRITAGTATDKDFALLGSIKSLTNLSVSTTAFGNRAAEAIASVTGLTRLDAAGSKLTNSGLDKLYALKNLSELILTGTEVSPQAAANFQAAMPQCRVSR